MNKLFLTQNLEKWVGQKNSKSAFMRRDKKIIRNRHDNPDSVIMTIIM